MSLILGYADDRIGIIMSDGRAGGTYRPSENYNKTLKLNDYIILGFCGEANYIEPFLDETKRVAGEDIITCRIDDLFTLWKYQVDNNTLPSAPLFTILGIGKDNNEKICAFKFAKAYDFELEYEEVKSPMLLLAGGQNEIMYYDMYKRNIIANREKVELGMRKTIEEVSLIDEWVNSNIFVQTV